MLSEVSAETYDVIAKVCKPKKPGEEEYESMVKPMDEYIEPPVSYLVYWTNLRLRTQQDNGSISGYVVALQTLAMDCDFPENQADDQVLDQLIIEMRSENIKAELLKIVDPKIDEASQKSFGSEA
ncbi:hypothetical protein QAD02_002429 [Eretmocerus hayati]|uniref:Uncharacterized protein n=1 Tax=Eretmocerus hayati TaxID=131215 RepID=A0ACC2NIV5_9HYME|nr:hypothetical protein QAD02_002429 [Eretmocerus hayati]